MLPAVSAVKGLKSALPALNELVEFALLFIVAKERELCVLELFEELIPVDRRERILATISRKIDPQQPRRFPFARCPFDAGWTPAARFHPLANLIVVDRRNSLGTGAALRS